MHNSDGHGREWEECPHCGKTKPVQGHEKPLPSVTTTRRFTLFRSDGIICLGINLSPNKAMEIQVGRFAPAPYFFCLEMGWDRQCDHAGPSFEVGVWGFHLMIKGYDTRHWDHGNKRWET